MALTERLFGTGFTFLGIGFPVLVATLAALREPGLSSHYGRALEATVLVVLPSLLLAGLQIACCLATMARWVSLHGLCLALTLALLLYLMGSATVWGLTSTVL